MNVAMNERHMSQDEPTPLRCSLIHDYTWPSLACM